MSKNKKIILYALFVMVLWGSLFPAVKMGYSAFLIQTGDVSGILLFAGVRFTLCGIIISAFGLCRHEAVGATCRQDILPILLTGLFSIILHYTCTYICLSYTDSSKTAILKQLGALLYICFGFLFFEEERFRVTKILGALIGFAGIVAINFDGGSVHFSVSDILIIVASICTVAGSVSSKAAMKHTSAIMTTGLSQLFGGVVLTVVATVMGGKTMQFSWNAMPIFVYICTASIIAYCLWNHIIKTSELSKMFLIKFAEPAFACIFGALLLGENIMKWQYLIAFILVAIGIVIGNLSDFNEREEKNNEEL